MAAERNHVSTFPTDNTIDERRITGKHHKKWIPMPNWRPGFKLKTKHHH